MDICPVRALALSPVTEPPPPRWNRMVRLGSAMLMSAFIAGLLPGIVLGMVIGPPMHERCNSAPDPIACLIQSLD